MSDLNEDDDMSMEDVDLLRVRCDGVQLAGYSTAISCVRAPGHAGNHRSWIGQEWGWADERES